MKKRFLKLIEKAKVITDFDAAINEMPNCYAKGYIDARLEMLLNSIDDAEEIREEIQEWADYDIWK